VRRGGVGTVVLVSGAGVGVVVRVVVLGTVDGVGYAFGDFVGSFVETVAERVILAVFVVISHITLKLLRGVGSGTSSAFYSNLGWIAGVDVVRLSALGRVAVVLGGVSLLGVACSLLVIG
jgi:hypothetical protein